MTEKVLSECSLKPLEESDAVTDAITCTYNALAAYYYALKMEFKPSGGRLSVLILGKSIQFKNLLKKGDLNGENFLRYSTVKYINT